MDDIAGGATILSFIIWLGLSAAYYIVCYVAVLNIINDLDTPFKIPVLLFASLPSAILMTIFNYQPLILGVLMGISNFLRIKALSAPNNNIPSDTQKQNRLFYTVGYLYILLACTLALYLQSPVNGKPYWETLIPQQ